MIEWIDIGDAIRRMRSGSMELPLAAPLPPEQCRGEAVGTRIIKDAMYFTIRVNEFYLAQNRQWWSVYDPMVIVEADFAYDGRDVTIPRVLGPDTISKHGTSGNDQKAKFGTILRDIPVIGPYPYRGGDVAVSVRLFAVERVNYAQSLLSITDQLSGVIGVPGQIETFSKVGAALVNGIGALAGLKETTFIAGMKLSTIADPTSAFQSGFSALIAPPTPKITDLTVRRRRLVLKEEEPYTKSDFVLFGIEASNTRGDESKLPFHRLKDRALQIALEGEKSWGRAKSTLLAAYQEMFNSPDLTKKEAATLFDQYMADLDERRIQLERVKALKAGAKCTEVNAEDVDELNCAASRLGF